MNPYLNFPKVLVRFMSRDKKKESKKRKSEEEAKGEEDGSERERENVK